MERVQMVSDMIVLFILSNMRTAMFWMRCSLVIWYCVTPKSSAFPLSSRDVMNTCIKASVAWLFRYFLIWPIKKYADFHIPLIWPTMVRSWSWIAPMFLADVVIGTSHNLTFKEEIDILALCCFLPITSTSVLPSFNQRIFDHPWFYMINVW